MCSALVLREAGWARGDAGGYVPSTSSTLGSPGRAGAQVAVLGMGSHPGPFSTQKSLQPAGMATGCHFACQGHGRENQPRNCSCLSKLDSSPLLCAPLCRGKEAGRAAWVPSDARLLSSFLPGISQGKGTERDFSVLAWFSGGEGWE